jgi:hypothetical protein
MDQHIAAKPSIYIYFLLCSFLRFKLGWLQFMMNGGFGILLALFQGLPMKHEDTIRPCVEVFLMTWCMN